MRGNQQYELRVESTSGGIVNTERQFGGMLTEDHAAGSSTTLMPVPEGEDFLFTGWTVNDTPMGLGELPLAMTDSADVCATFTRKKYIIAGRLAESNGNAMVGVAMNVSNGAGTTTDANGFYTLVVDSGWTGTVTPELGGHVLTFGGQQAENGQPYSEPVRNDILFQNYSAATEVAVTGQVLLAGDTGLADVLLDGFPQPVSTTADGTFSTSLPSGWSGTVALAQAGYSFTPPTFTYANVTTDLSGQDAVGTGTPTVTISGQVVDMAGNGVGGVVLFGIPGAPLTGSDGTYSVPVNTGWSGTVTPQYPGGILTPIMVTHTAVLADVTQNYSLIRQYTLTAHVGGTGAGSVTSATPGIDCGTDCSETYTQNTQVTLSAAPEAGSTFTGWSGSGCSGTGTCTVTLAQATEVSAVFTEDTLQKTLIVVTSGEGGGTVLSMPSGVLCGVDCTEVVDDGATLTLRAIPYTGSTFDGWAGGGCSGNDDCTLTLTQDAIVTAEFSPAATLIVEKAGTGTGTVIADDIDCGSTCENTYDAGTGVVLKAVPDVGSTFTGWAVNGQPSGCLVILDGETTVTATFGQ